jgi:hypothetical protein
MSVKQIDYKGKTIIYVDYRGLLKIEQHLQNIDETTQMMKGIKPPVLMISNFEGVSVGNEFMSKVKGWGKEHQAVLGRQAVLGVTGLKSILFQGYLTFTGEKNMKAFDNEAEAKDWLVG